MAGYDIKESLIDPLAPYPFDFVFNEHFLTNVNMHQFDYKPYISNFLFGLFCFIRCLWSGMRTWDTGPTFRHMFYSLKTKDQVRWIVSVDWRNEHQIHFFNFHLGDKLIDYDEPISKQLYEKVVSYIKSEEHYNKKNESIKYTSHDYLIYPMKGSSETMQIMMKKIARRVPLIIDDDGNNGNAWTNYSFIKYFVCGTYNLYPNFWPFFGSVDKIQKSLGYAEQMLNIAGKSLYRGSDPASVCAFIHGFYFSRIEDFYDTLYLHHHKHNNIDWFYLTGYNWSPQYHHPPFTMSFISHIGQPTFVSRTTDHTTDCGLNNRNGLSGYAYISEPVDRCKLEQKSLYNNSLDYLSNIFEYAQNLTQKKFQIGELATYLNQIFDQVRPSYAKHDKTSTKFLKYFIMGTFISTEQKFYQCLVHELTDVLIFKPKSEGYPIIILTLNTDYQIINLQDLELNATYAITSFLLISIEETFRKSDSYLSRSFFTRKIETKLLPINTLARDEKARLDWIKLKQSPFLSQLLNISQSYDEAADEDVVKIIKNVFSVLYVDYANSFNPFMQGLFYRTRLARQIRAQLSTYISRWTCKVSIRSDWLFHLQRSYYIYFLPSLDAAIMFLYSPKDYGERDVVHISIMNNPEVRSLRYNYYKDHDQSDVYSMIADDVCDLYSDIDETLCDLSFGGKRLLSGLLPQSVSFVLTAILRHLEVIENLATTDSQQMQPDVTTLNISQQTRFKRKASVISTVKKNFKKAKGKYKKVKKKLRPITKAYNVYKLGRDIKELVEKTISTVKEPSTGAVIGLTKDYTAMTKTLFQGGVKILKYLKVISKGAKFLGPIGITLTAVSTACSIASTLYDVTKQIMSLSEVIELTTWQIVVEGARLAVGLRFSRQTQLRFNITAEKNMNFKNILYMTGEGWNFPKYGAYVSSYFCRNTKDSCVGSIVELDKPQFVEYTDSRYYTKNPTSNPQLRILCADSYIVPPEKAIAKNKKNINATSSYFCHNAFAIVNDSANPHVPLALYDLGPQASVKGFNNYSNHFRILHDFVVLEGGQNDDFFDLISNLTCGYAKGGDGFDTIKLNQHKSSEYELIITKNSVGYKRLGQKTVNQCLQMDSIERIIGQVHKTETIFVHCSFDMISLNGGQSNSPDRIYIQNSSICTDTVSIILSGSTIVENVALGGRYLYKVANLDMGDIKLSLFGGSYIDKNHIVIIDYAPISKLANIIYTITNGDNETVTIVDKTGNTFYLMFDPMQNPTQIIFKDGEEAEFQDGLMHITVNTNDLSLGSLMHKYGQVRFADSVSITFGSVKLGTRIRLRSGTIQYNNENPSPYKLFRFKLKSASSAVECSSGHTYVVFLCDDYPENLPTFDGVTIITFTARQKSHTTEQPVSLTIDFTYILDILDAQDLNYSLVIKPEEIEDSETFKATGTLILENEYWHTFVLYFDGFTKYDRLENIRFLTHLEYAIKLKRSSKDFIHKFDGYFPPKSEMSEETKLELIKLPTIFNYHPDYLLTLKPNDVEWGEDLTFPNVHLTDYDVIKIENTLVMTSIRSNYYKDIFKAANSFFTIIFQDFYINKKMESLTLKFADGNKIAANALNNFFVFNLTEYKKNVENVERYLTKKDVDLIDHGGVILHEWREFIFDSEQAQKSINESVEVDPMNQVTNSNETVLQPID